MEAERYLGIHIVICCCCGCGRGHDHGCDYNCDCGSDFLILILIVNTSLWCIGERYRDCGCGYAEGHGYCFGERENGIIEVAVLC